MGYEILFLDFIANFLWIILKNCNNFIIKKCLKIVYYPNYL